MGKRTLILILVCVFAAFAGDSVPPAPENPPAEEKLPLALVILAYPFTHVVQPVFELLLFPVAKPLDYMIKTGAVGKGVELFSFGKEKNIFIFPTMNLSPGSKNSLGISYRHRNLFFAPDYLSMATNQYANGDWSFTAGYNKHQLFGSKISTGIRFRYDADRDASFTVPDSSTAFSFCDSSFSTEIRFSRQVPYFPFLSFTAQADFRWNRTDIPESISDSIFPADASFNRYSHGIYQDFLYVPISASLTFDNLDAPYMPTRGSRIILNWTYGKVGDYRGHNTDAVLSNRYSHDFQTIDLVAQHYIFLGTSGTRYNFTYEEGEKNRRYYTDFSWGETVRMWKPENIRNTLFQRRVLAFQFRARQLFEMEPGGAPYRAFPSISSRFPLRGYNGSFTDYAIMGISMEYRWPIDRLVDGVVFNEYAVYQRNLLRFETDHLRNSWGFGIRVRRPEMYFFRVQLGFHGFDGINFVMTIAPEFQ
ncbi:MAG: hypothetical protein LBR60_08960 [Fibrobacter sp.]|jgi:outer membrane protein assembly factor BamA|nr:hypothetical protein [Fibrobacter sp.]